jgi:NAD-dependent dihydropyrimidine dehydrogenase PreA subunit
MSYVITDRCVGNKDASCTEVCPVECIHPTPDEDGFAEAEMLYIDPDECIDCDACFESCPFKAIYPKGQLPADLVQFAEINAAHFAD